MKASCLGKPTIQSPAHGHGDALGDRKYLTSCADSSALSFRVKAIVGSVFLTKALGDAPIMVRHVPGRAVDNRRWVSTLTQ